MALIQISDIRALIYLPSSVNEADLSNRIREAELFDLKPQIGKELYEDLVSNPSQGKNPELISFLAPSICYYAYARFLENAQNTPSNYGFVKKETPYSERVSFKEIKEKASNNRNIAFSLLNGAIDFINKNRSDFPLWKGAPTYKKTGLKIDRLSNNH
jgi:hypothetical protein